MQHFKIATALIFSFLIFAGSAWAADKEGDSTESPAEVEKQLSYAIPAHFKLGTVLQRPAPFYRFEIFVDSAGVGHLQSRVVNDPKHPRVKPAAVSEQGLILDWADRTSFLDEHRGWSRLTVQDARQIWKSERAKGGVFTFDVPNTHHGEPNIFHLDLVFSDNAPLQAYRVRGIGIRNPQWIGPQGNLDFDRKSQEQSSAQPATNSSDAEAKIYVLNDKKGKPVFKVSVDRNHTGQLQSYAPGIIFKGVPDWWNNTLVTHVLKDGSTISHTMAFGDALEIWGEPRGHEERFFTFDAPSLLNQEPEIFHLDLEFGGELRLIGFRVRGMGIDNPQWVR